MKSPKAQQSGRCHSTQNSSPFVTSSRRKPTPKKTKPLYALHGSNAKCRTGRKRDDVLCILA